MAVAVRTSPNFDARSPRILFETGLPESTPSRYDVASDGRFLVLAAAPDSKSEERAEIHVIVNWFETLRDKR